MERPQAPWHEASCLAQDPHPSPGRRMENSPRGGIDAQTLEIRAAEFTTSDVGPSLGLQANQERATDAPTRRHRVCHIGFAGTDKREASMSEIGILAIDLAKNSFQVCGVTADGVAVFNKSVSRSRLIQLLSDQKGSVAQIL